MVSIFNSLDAVNGTISESMRVSNILTGFDSTDESRNGPVMTLFQTMDSKSMQWDRAMARLRQEYLAIHSSVGEKKNVSMIQPRNEQVLKERVINRRFLIVDAKVI